MPRNNAAKRDDLQSYLETGRDSQKASANSTQADRSYTNHYPGAGLFIRRAARSVSDRRKGGRNPKR